VTGPLGAQFLLWEYATAIAGRIIGINPFDQPNVEAAKIQARSLLDATESASTEKPAFVDGAVEVYASPDALGDNQTLAALIDSLGQLPPPAGYLSLQAYLNRLADASAADLRRGVAARSGQQTTFGWGPRFLHSTGQYHKGGHPNGAFVQITGVVEHDLEIPGRPYTFATLQAAQAAGDAAVLVGTGRPVLRLHLTDRAAGIGQLLNLL
jgi:glucose-6-phosphate isomerase